MAVIRNSPWAKFTTSMSPKISDRPAAISAYISPVSRPLTRIWMTISAVSMGPQAFPMPSRQAPPGRASGRPEGKLRREPRSAAIHRRCRSRVGLRPPGLTASMAVRFRASGSRLEHRPDRLGDGGLRREDGHRLALGVLQQHRVRVVVLAILVELHALPGHDRALAGNIG